MANVVNQMMGRTRGRICPRNAWAGLNTRRSAYDAGRGEEKGKGGAGVPGAKVV